MSGFSSPNHTQVPNDLFDMLPFMTGAELKIVMHAIRQTLGYHRTCDMISVSQFMKGTGLARQSVVDGIAAAMERGVLQEKERGKRGAIVYQLIVSSDAAQASTSPETRPVQKLDQSENQTGTGLKTRPVKAATGLKTRHTKEKELKETEIKTSNPNEGLEVPPPIMPKPKRTSPHEPEYRELLKADRLKAETMTKSADAAYWQVAAELHRAAFPVERIGELAEYVQRRKRGENWNSLTVRAYAKYAPDFLRDSPRIRLLEPDAPVPATVPATESPPAVPLSAEQRQQAEQALVDVMNKFGGRREQQHQSAKA